MKAAPVRTVSVLGYELIAQVMYGIFRIMRALVPIFNETGVAQFGREIEFGNIYSIFFAYIVEQRLIFRF